MLRRVGRASTCRPRCAAPRRSSGWGCRRRRTATPRAAAPPPLRGAPGSRGEDAAWPAALPAEHHRLPRVVERGAWRKGAATPGVVRHGAEHPQSAISGPLTACPRRACMVTVAVGQLAFGGLRSSARAPRGIRTRRATQITIAPGRTASNGRDRPQSPFPARPIRSDTSASRSSAAGFY